MLAGAMRVGDKRVHGALAFIPLLSLEATWDRVA
jgi:hypothetical protein